MKRWILPERCPSQGASCVVPKFLHQGLPVQAAALLIFFIYTWRVQHCDITAGSRGIKGLADILRAAVMELKSKNFNTFYCSCHG